MSEATYSFRVIWSEEDASYVATCPEFDGISGLGPTVETAITEARAALRLAIETHAAEGWALPAPTLHTEQSGQFRLRLPRSVHARLVQCAADEGVSLNALVSSLIALGLGLTEPKRAVGPRVQLSR